MPMPNPFLNDKMYEEYRWRSFAERAHWAMKFCWWPQRCTFSKRLVWLETARQGQAVWTGPGDPVVEHRWADPQEYLIHKIKGEVN